MSNALPETEELAKWLDRIPSVNAQQAAARLRALDAQVRASDAENDRLCAEQAEKIGRLEEALRPFALVATEYDRWQRKGSITKADQLGFAYGNAKFGMSDFRRALQALSNNRPSQGEEGK